MLRAALPLLKDVNAVFAPLEEEDALYDLAQTLPPSAASASTPGLRLSRRGKAREYIHACFAQNITLDTLANVSGRDRWSLSRDFRALFGASPWRYVMMRRLDFLPPADAGWG